ncbi:hypothetical protein FI667_g8496, partial [Globisporangium splendens]
MPVKFPTKKALFPPVELTDGDCRLYEQRAETLVRTALAEYDHYIEVMERDLDKKTWKAIMKRENVTVYRKRGDAMRGSQFSGSNASTPQTPTSLSATLALGATKIGGWFTNADKGNGDWSLPPLLAVGSIPGTLDDVMYGVTSCNETAMFLKSTYTDNEVVDGEVLYSIKTPTPAKPYQFVGLKWVVKSHPTGIKSVVWPRDLVYLESTGILKRPNGERIGYQLMHSVNVPECNDLRKKGILRATMSSCYLFKQMPKGAVEVYMKAHVEPNGKVSDSIALKSTATSLISCRKLVTCAQRKKLAYQLQAKRQMQQDELEMDPFASMRSEEKRGSKSCGVCGSRVAGKRRITKSCALCESPICSRCRVSKKLSFKGASAKQIKQRAVLFCMSCVATTSQTGTFIIARDEVRAMQSGPHSDASASKDDCRTQMSEYSRRSSERPISGWQSERSTAVSSIASPFAVGMQQIYSDWKPRLSHSFDITAPITEPHDREFDLCHTTFDDLDGVLEPNSPIYHLPLPEPMSPVSETNTFAQSSCPGLTHQQQLWLQMAELRDAAENAFRMTKRNGESHLASSHSSRSLHLDEF